MNAQPAKTTNDPLQKEVTTKCPQNEIQQKQTVKSKTNGKVKNKQALSLPPWRCVPLHLHLHLDLLSFAYWPTTYSEY